MDKGKKQKAKENKIVSFTKKHFRIIIIIIIIILFIIDIVLSSRPFFWLNENQMLYLFTDMAQIIGTLFGLLITAYVFYIDKQKIFRDNPDNEELSDAVNNILKQCYHKIFSITIVSGFTILICLFSISALNTIPTFVCSFLINTSTVLFVFGVILILYNAAQLLNPNRIENEMNDIKERLVSAAPKDEETYDGMEYIRCYSELDNTLREIANILNPYRQSNSYHRFNSNHKYGYNIKEIQETLLRAELMDYSLKQELDTYRSYRNSLAHVPSTPNPPKSYYNRLKEITEVFNKIPNILAPLKEPNDNNYTELIEQARKEIQRLNKPSQN